MTEDEQHDDGKRAARRGFLAAAASVPALAAAAALLAKRPAGEAAPAAGADNPEKSQGYRETEHIRKYYSTAAF